ncbi:DUF1552 domain-containing protein [Pseudobacteriovorax antillogorgiicola]|uniref:DUF1552 domain-containing protein n=1 Tax=Pseudobacteriovorax antillogorgiicola TaxID=1513793 RepID=A0A1Y6C9H0_9BACT|nr:DUF1552 domain-containing protein [Pseudobacteriovorax antillogorgiicola]TCS49108.1 uncharacterized protein DUF1552 [Pseudobacteriovorax antillogorgiicola]SMF51644.1 Protein of unknown function [Pseudobacteriovorax antillogorgiicola]
MKIDRRHFFKFSGNSLIALSMARALRATDCQAAELGMKRAILVYMPTGAIDFAPAGPSQSFSAVDESYFPDLTKPLFSLKDDLLILSGMTHYSPPGGAAPNNHFEGYAPGLALPSSGTYGGPSHVFAGGGGYSHLDAQAALSGRNLESLDHYLARNNPGIKSVHLGYNSSHPTSINSNISYRLEDGVSKAYDIVDDPLKNYMDLFGLFSNGQGASVQGLNLQDVGSIYAGKKRLLDFIYKDIAQFKDKIGNDAFTVLQESIDSIDSIGKQLQDKINEQGSPGGAIGSIQECVSNPLGSGLDQMKAKAAQNPKWYHAEENLPLVADVNNKIMVNAMACGAQVGVLQFGCGHSAFGFRFNDIEVPPGEHHSSSHGKGTAYRASQKGIIQQVASIATSLKSLQLANGSSVLDETLILLSSCMGDSDAHDGRNVPTLMIGGAGGAINKGQYIALGQNEPGSYNRLLTTVAHALGHKEVDSFGINVNKQSISGVSGVIPGVLKE